ncbi:MAG: UDP-N-acetylglucosamine 2-epimerase (non-hydrolyzing) [Hellea sp.]|nr:UDP-N-acetylglucosamine 2-epimerase (non-hydrolyzing) [Hellea sp.]
MTMKKVLCIIGTRPEAIKMAPVILALQASKDFNPVVLATAQHRELLDKVFAIFGIVPDFDLNVMKPNQTLPALTAKLITALDEKLETIKPDIVLAQGDTTTVMVSSIAAFYKKIPFGHIEAGLRTHNMSSPFPEEMNRVIAGHLAKWHFAPTESTKKNLLREGIPASMVHVTGNTVIDALYSMIDESAKSAPYVAENRRLILVTAHRRENFGRPFKDICRAIRFLVDNNSDIDVLFPVHPNPNIKSKAEELLGDINQVTLCDPLDYIPFIGAMKAAYLILSDSGGVQEEAPALGRPVLVLRNETERPEAISHGCVKLVGTNFDVITREAMTLLNDKKAYNAMAIGASPYGDGRATQRILNVLRGPLTS